MFQIIVLKQKHIVIIGAGFAGLRLSRMLSNHSGYQVTLIDKNNYHQFQPLLYQVATANLDASNISFPLRAILEKSKNVKIRITDVNCIKPEKNRIETSIGTIYYDYLVIATGANTNYFGNKNMERYAFPMKSTVEALQLRNQLIQNFEKATVLADTIAIEQLLTIVVVGGGPTGIELSGALAELKRDTLPQEYRELDFNKMKIYLLEGSDKVLGNMSTSASFHSQKYLEEMGVIVKVKSIVEDYDGSRLLLQDGTVISAALVIWTAGVIGNIPEGINKDIITKSNRIRVDNYHKVLGTENIFALGDIAFMGSKDYPLGHPQLGSVAVDQAKNLGENFKRMSKKEPIQAYTYRNKGTMATVGRNKAVVDLARPRISFRGFGAWFIWMTVHLFLLISFKNRLMVFINWVYKYFTRNESLSLLFPLFSRDDNKTKSGKKVEEVHEISI